MYEIDNFNQNINACGQGATRRNVEKHGGGLNLEQIKLYAIIDRTMKLCKNKYEYSSGKGETVFMFNTMDAVIVFNLEGEDQ